MASSINENLPLRFETMAKQAISPLPVITFLSKKAPIDGNSSRITQYRSYHASDQKAEEDMEDN